MEEKTEEKQAVELIRVYKLNPAHLKVLEKACTPPFVARDTTDIQAGFMLGIQYVLGKIREGIQDE